MLSTAYFLFYFSVLAPIFVAAANDWSVPCVSGSCSWDTGDGKITAYSSMAIGGTNSLISDITPAAGWNIQDCDPNWANGTQTVQLTCSGPSNATVYCGHVFEGGAEDTIVRLPENCGKGPFARVVKASNKSDSIARRITNANANATITGTHSFTLDYNFAQIPTSRGKATFAVTSTNLKGQPGVSKRELEALRGRGRAGELHRKRFASMTQRSIGDVANNAVSAVTSAAGAAASSIGNAVSNANTINKTLNSGQPTPVSFNQDVTLFDQSISCSSGDISGSAELKIDVDGKVDATVSFGVTVVGTIVPPQLTDFSVNANLGGSTGATFNIDATADGTFDTGAVPLFKSGLPGLSIPSVITLGPEFSINSQVTINLQAEAKLAIEAAWDFPSINMVFPQDKGSSTGSATASGTNNPLQLSADPSVNVSGTVTAHIIPRIDFGVDLFSGSDQASVFIDTDISASLNMQVTAQRTVNNSDTTTTSSSTDAATSTTDSAALAANTTLSTPALTTTDTSGFNSTTDTGLSTDTASVTDTSSITTTEVPLSTSTTDSLATSTTDSIASSTTDPLATSTTDPLASSTTDPLATSTDDPLATSTDDPLATSADDSLATSTDDPLATSTDDPLATSVDDSLATSTDDPFATSTDDPLATSTDDPLATPTDDPLAAPTDDPFASTDTVTSSTDSGGTTDTSSLDDPSLSGDGTDTSGDGSGGSGFRRRSWPVLSGRDTSSSLNGCITLSVAISINGGLQGSLAPFINDQQTFPIFSNSVQLFQKCLNGPPSGGSSPAGRRRRHSMIMRRAGDTSGLQCPTKGAVSALQSII